jgi:aminoglycoside 3-N-acetyltransferase
MTSLGWWLELSPYIEVGIRNVYWRTTPLVRWFNARKKKPKAPAAAKAEAPQPQTTITRVVAALQQRGVGRGDLIVVHSSFRALRADGAKPDAIIDALLALIGPEGTLAMPAIAVYAEGPAVTELMTADVSDLVCEYDPFNTPTWTGALPITMLRRPGAARSLHPLNSMVALGPMAEPMMRQNLDGEKPLPCGVQSSWNFCARNGAKVLAIGADMTHSLTMIHVAEDVMDEAWPVRGWYRDRKFNIVTGGARRLQIVRERHPKWAMYYGERTLSKDLRRQGLMTRDQVDGVNVEILGAGPLVAYLNARNQRGYPYYLLPRSSLKAR